MSRLSAGAKYLSARTPHRCQTAPGRHHRNYLSPRFERLEDRRLLALPADFVDELLLDDLDQPVALTLLPDEQMLVLERDGTILITDPLDAQPSAEPYLDIPFVDDDSEKGLLNIVLDPDFENNNYFYVYYHNQQADRARISRFTHDVDHAHLEDEVLIWEDNLDTSTQLISDHWGGGLSFGPDNMLYLTLGDKKDNPADAQDLSLTAGKIIRVDPSGVANGGPWVDGGNNDHLIPDDNPFINVPGALDEIWGRGLRNPFRASWDLVTGQFIIGEVGDNIQTGPDASHEDIHVVTVADGGVNFGWPNCEGPDCVGPPPFNYSPPIYSIQHPDSRALVAGFIYRGNQFPSTYHNALFMADFVQGWLRYLTFDANGNVSQDVPVGGHRFSDDGDLGAPVMMVEGPEGALYYVDIVGRNANGGGQLRRIAFDSGNLPPVIQQATASPTEGPADLTVSFAGLASDPENDALTYLWTFGDGSQATGANVSHTYTSTGQYSAVLAVSDAEHTTISNSILIQVGLPPTATITRPDDGDLFRAGDQIALFAVGGDPDGTLGNNDFAWTVRFQHDTHFHPVLDEVLGRNVVLDIPTSGHDFSGATGYEISLVVTDSDGLTATDTISIFPDKVDLTFNSTVPGGVTFTLDQVPRVGPFSLDTLIDFQHTIVAPLTVVSAGRRYEFAGWSNGVTTASQTLLVPDGDQTYTAVYTDLGGAPMLFVADQNADDSFRYTPDGVLLGNSDLSPTNAGPRGVAADPAGGRYWVVDNGGVVFAYDPEGVFQHSWQFTGIGSPQGIAANGTDVWIVSAESDRVYRIAGGASLTSGTHAATSSFALDPQNKNPYGITTDGTNTWVVDDTGSARKVFKYTVSGTFVGSWDIDPGNNNPRGLSLDPSQPNDILIIDDQSQNRIFRYAGAASRNSGNQSAAAEILLAAGNNSPSGIAGTTGGQPPTTAPVLIANNLTIGEGQSVTLSASQLSATDPDSDDDLLIFSVSNVAGGQFQVAGSVAASFTQQQVTAGQVVFMHDDGEAAPHYEVTVSDGVLSDGPAGAVIDFANVNDNPPVIPAGQTFMVSESAAVGTLVGTISFSDADLPGDSFTLTITAGDQENAFALDNAGNLTVAGDLDFDANPVYTLTIQVADGAFQTSQDVVIEAGATTSTFFVVDQRVDDTFSYTKEGVLLGDSMLRAGNSVPRGIGADPDGSQYWVVDRDGFVYVYDTEGDFKHSWQFTGFADPQGIASDGTDIWIVSAAEDRVYRFAGGASLTGGTHSASSSFPLDSENLQPFGITSDAANVWIVNDTNTQQRVFKYNVLGTLEGSWDIDPDNQNPRGITIDPTNGNDIWIVDDQSQNRIFHYVGATSRTAGSQLAFDTLPLAANNRSPQGIADPALTTPFIPPPVPSPWQNPRNAKDVDNDTFVSTTDVLSIVIFINLNPGVTLNPLPVPTPDFQPPPYYDVNGDGFVSAGDVLTVVQCLNDAPQAASGLADDAVSGSPGATLPGEDVAGSAAANAQAASGLPAAGPTTSPVASTPAPRSSSPVQRPRHPPVVTLQDQTARSAVDDRDAESLTTDSADDPYALVDEFFGDFGAASLLVEPGLQH